MMMIMDPVKNKKRLAIIANIRKDHSCFGHYSIMHCMNLGYLKHERNKMGILCTKKCPFERICQKETAVYAKDSDLYNEGKIDKPREWIRRLEQGKRGI